MKDNNRGFPAGAHDPIAIVGMACNLPGDNRSPEAFFDFLLKKKCGIVEIPGDRWQADAFFDPDPDGIATAVSKWAVSSATCVALMQSSLAFHRARRREWTRNSDLPCRALSRR